MLQMCENKSDGSPASQLLEIRRGMLADGLRESLVTYMIEDISELNALLGPNLTDLNAHVITVKVPS